MIKEFIGWSYGLNMSTICAEVLALIAAGYALLLTVLVLTAVQ